MIHSTMPSVSVISDLLKYKFVEILNAFCDENLKYIANDIARRLLGGKRRSEDDLMVKMPLSRRRLNT